MTSASGHWAAQADSISRLDQACLNALEECEQFFRALGLRATVGGEVEWYALLDTQKPVNRRAIREEFLGIAEKDWELISDPNIFFYLKDKDEDIPPQWTAESARARAVSLADKYITKAENDVCAAEMLLRLRVAKAMKEEGIGVYSTQREYGAINNHATIVNFDEHGRMYHAIGQQLEIALAHTGPVEQARRITRVRQMIKEESRAVGLTADFQSAPYYTFTQHDDTVVSLFPANAQHIHYGLQKEQDGDITNALTVNDRRNRLSDSCYNSLFALVQQGGQLLANPSVNDYIRLRGKNSNIPRELGVGAKTAFKDHFMVFDHNDSPENTHDELRLPGGNAPPSAAILLPVLSIVDGVLQCMEGRPVGTLPEIASRMDRHDSGLAEAMNSRSQNSYLPETRFVKKAFGDAAQQLTSDSRLHTYVPEVFAALKQLEGHEIYR